MCPSIRFLLVLPTGLFLMGASARAGTFVYQDDFETDAAMYDSWRHSHFVEMLPDIALYGFLHYEPGASGRGLGLYPGFDLPLAFLAYRAVPDGMVATGGSLTFLLLPNSQSGPPGWRIRVHGSIDGMTWSLMGEGQAAGPLPRLVSVPIAPGNPAHFLQLSDTGLIDDLHIEVAYEIPEPTTFCLLVLGGLVVGSPTRPKVAACK